MMYFWMALTVVLIVLEAVTVQLVSIWFALGALCALVCELCNLDIIWQCLVFALVSLIALACTRPFVKKLTLNKKTPTNADRCIGEKAIVTETINNNLGCGQVKLKGIVWTARSTDDEKAIDIGASVTVCRIDGVKLIVSPSDAKLNV